jgi:hypothetical protein
LNFFVRRLPLPQAQVSRTCSFCPKSRATKRSHNQLRGL